MHNEGVVTLNTLIVQKPLITAIAKTHGASDIRVFGSVARGENQESRDLDLLVDLDEGRTLFDLAGFVADVQDLLGVRVDVVTTGGLRYLRDAVLAEAIPL